MRVGKSVYVCVCEREKAPVNRLEHNETITLVGSLCSFTNLMYKSIKVGTHFDVSVSTALCQSKATLLPSPSLHGKQAHIIKNKKSFLSYQAFGSKWPTVLGYQAFGSKWPTVLGYQVFGSKWPTEEK